jgi:hypothetical protein
MLREHPELEIDARDSQDSRHISLQPSRCPIQTEHQKLKLAYPFNQQQNCPSLLRSSASMNLCSPRAVLALFYSASQTDSSKDQLLLRHKQSGLFMTLNFVANRSNWRRYFFHLFTTYLGDTALPCPL